MTEMKNDAIVELAGECIIAYECIRYCKTWPLAPPLEVAMKVATIFRLIIGLLTLAPFWELECEKVQTYVWTYWWRPSSGLTWTLRFSRSQCPDLRMDILARE